ncbi:MAG: HEAT repeat domain-containing protein [Bradymonadales bacterium]|nr:MAG: HEAT repeat domain-containing protein [Bradymonadales bacterium]
MFGALLRQAWVVVILMGSSAQIPLAAEDRQWSVSDVAKIRQIIGGEAPCESATEVEWSSLSTEEKGALVRSWGQSGDQRHIPFLLDLLRDAETPRTILFFAQASLLQLNSETATALLLKLISSPNRSFDQALVSISAARFVPERPVWEALFRVVKNRDEAPHLRLQALQSLRVIGGIEVLETLGDLLLEGRLSDLERDVIQQIGFFEEKPLAFSILAEVLNDSSRSDDARLTAILGLVRIGSEEVSATLINFIDQSLELGSADVIRASLSALGAVGDHQSMDYLFRQSVEATDPEIGYLAARTLSRVQDPKVLEYLRRAFLDDLWHEEWVWEALWRVLQFEATEVLKVFSVSEMIPILGAPQAHLRNAAVKFLLKLDEDQRNQALAAFVEEPLAIDWSRLGLMRGRSVLLASALLLRQREPESFEQRVESFALFDARFGFQSRQQFWGGDEFAVLQVARNTTRAYQEFKRVLSADPLIDGVERSSAFEALQRDIQFLTPEMQEFLLKEFLLATETHRRAFPSHEALIRWGSSGLELMQAYFQERQRGLRSRLLLSSQETEIAITLSEAVGWEPVSKSLGLELLISAVEAELYRSREALELSSDGLDFLVHQRRSHFDLPSYREKSDRIKSFSFIYSRLAPQMSETQLALVKNWVSEIFHQPEADEAIENLSVLITALIVQKPEWAQDLEPLSGEAKDWLAGN